ncbi:hypothetical protein PybrP1_011047 [[Pythium] brassicae (nom. inval.)]|nr:hypothetical protein PybrP1_011047 [[Pythium] brassicae (nom. inval.)]
MQCIAADGDDDVAVDLFGECAAPVSTTFVSVDGGDGFSMAVDASGVVVGWGSAFYGELAESPTDEPRRAHVHVRVPPIRIAVPEQCVQVAATSPLTPSRNAAGHVYAWGWNRHHQVSPGATEVRSVPVLVDFTSSATAETTPTPVRAVAAGGMHSLALDSDGRVWSWGDNTHGQLGTGSDASVGASPAPLSLERRALSVSAGWAHSALLTDSDELLTFGFGLYHQLGHGTTQNRSTPLAVDALRGLDASCGGPVVQVACGNWHTAGSCSRVVTRAEVHLNSRDPIALAPPARTASGDVYTWGWGRDGQLVSECVEACASIRGERVL